jgi:hypothetical protein
MAQYDIAAATRRISPVQEMMQYGLQQDARKINALNIQKAEIQMPYVEQLTQQQVRQNELGIEEAETRMPFLKTQLEQQQEMTDLQIDQMHREAKAQQRFTNFQEAYSSGQYSPQELRKTFPIEWGQQRLSEVQTMLQEQRVLTSELEKILAFPEDQQAAAYNAAVSQYGGEGKMPPYESLGPQGLREIVRATTQRSRSAVSELISDLEYYRSLGTTEGDHLASIIERYLEKTISGNPTQMEALASANWPGESNPVQKQMDFQSLGKDYANAFAYRMRQEFARVSSFEMATLEAMDVDRLVVLAQEELGSDGYQIAMENVQRSTEDWMRSQYGDKWQWYKHHRARLDGVPEPQRPALPETLREAKAGGVPLAPPAGTEGLDTTDRPSAYQITPDQAKPGDVVDGYRFKGGNWQNQDNWEKVE